MIEWLGGTFLLIMALVGILLGVDCYDNHVRKDFIKIHTSKPYCLDDTATVMDKTVTLKRCFSVIEVEGK